jgi:hypothetical protein
MPCDRVGELMLGMVVLAYALGVLVGHMITSPVFRAHPTSRVSPDE